MNKKIVIIGGGPAGLTCAYSLLKNDKNCSVLVLEQDVQVGGISKTVEFDGYRIDTGIHRFFTKNDEVQALWEEIMPIQAKPSYDDILLQKEKEYPAEGSDPETEDASFLIRDRVTRIFYGKKFYDYPVSMNRKTICNMGFFTLMKAGFSYLKSCVIKREEKSLEDFYINRFGKVLYSMFFESYTEKVWGIHPSKISPDWGEQRVKGLSIMAVLKDVFRKTFHKKNADNTETSLIESFYYPKLGSGQMYELMAEKIKEMGGSVLCNAQVTKIHVEGDKIQGVTYVCDGEEKRVEADVCCSSMPIKDLIEGMDVQVPEEIAHIAKELPYREFMSVGLVVDKLYLKNDTQIRTLGDVIPDSWIYVQEPDVKMGRIQIFNNWSPYIFSEKTEIENKVFLSLEYFCSEGDKYWEMSDEQFEEFAMNEAIKLDMIKPESVSSKVRVKIKKAYPAYFGVYKEFDHVVAYLDGFENLYCIGRNGQHRYNNMDHSMLTGIETARCILDASKDRQLIWKVNTEKEYHETKKERG